MARSGPGLEIERRFLLRALPPLVPGRITRILQGYLSWGTGGATIRVRSMGRRRFFTVKSGGGLLRREFETRISNRLFKMLWEFTSDSRIEKERHQIRCGGLVVEVDVFAGELEPLVIAEIECDSLEEALGLDLPDWMGTEITGLPEYSNAALSRSGLPDTFATLRPRKKDPVRPLTHAGVLPYRVDGKGMQILTIPTRSGKRWIIPKGVWDNDLPATAGTEAWEEAGITGKLEEPALGIIDDDRGGFGSRIIVYPFQVESESEDWPERDIRERRWISPDEAASTIEYPEIGTLLSLLRSRIGL